jgi:hypothetical protein
MGKWVDSAGVIVSLGAFNIRIAALSPRVGNTGLLCLRQRTAAA